MKFIDFQDIMSIPRMGRYLAAMGGDSRAAMTLYRLNLRLTQELFTLVSCFEIALRNRIDGHYSAKLGPHWLRNASSQGGMFNTSNCGKTPYIAALDFGFWRYTFARHQFFAGGQSLLAIFPAKPSSSAAFKFNHTYIFSELEKVNLLRNRLAHHEPVCFLPGKPIKDTSFSRQQYALILRFFQWMSIDEAALLYGIDHVNALVRSIDAL